MKRLLNPLVALSFAATALCADAVAKPNIVIILADDLGWADVGYHDKQRADTPNIDRLAVEGIELDRFYVAPMCSPTRAGLMTGRYPIRFGLARAVVPPQRDYGLSVKEETIADALAKAGYAHRGIFGKWHLGHHRAQWHPLRRGFTHFHGHYNGAIDFFALEREGERDWHIDWEPSDEQGYSTDLIAAAASAFIEEHAGDDGPFFCYVPFNAPHSPFQAKTEDLARYEKLGGDAERVGPDPKKGKLDTATKRRALAAMIWSMDEGIGRILGAIDDAGIRDNTIVWFFSDNGGIRDIPNNNRPLRGDKLDVFEGGVRSPSCVRWPAAWPGGRKLKVPASHIDILPTVLAAAGGSSERDLDGVDLGPILRGEQDALAERDLYFYHGQQGADQEEIAIATPDWKLVVLGPQLGEEGLADANEVFLFAMPGDLLEKNNVAEQHPEVVRELVAKLITFRALQPGDAIPVYTEGKKGFEPWKDWRIPREE